MADFTAEWIWPDDDGINVHAQGFGMGIAESITIIFVFRADRRKPPTSLANRVCIKHLGSKPDDPANTFPTEKEANAAAWAAIRHIWPQCVAHPELKGRLQGVVELDSIDSSTDKLDWDIYCYPVLFPKA